MDLVLQILSWLAEDELNGIKQAQAEGIAEAKKKGKHLGRPQINLNTLTPAQRNTLDTDYPLWKNNELSDSRIYPESGTRRNEDNFMELSASRFGLLLEDAQEVYYPNLNVSELIIPMTYVIPGKYASGDPNTYKLHFVKNNDNQVQLIYDGFFVGGSHLEKKDQDEVDPYNPEKLKLYGVYKAAEYRLVTDFTIYSGSNTITNITTAATSAFSQAVLHRKALKL